MRAGLIYRGKGHDEDAARFLVKGVKIDGSVGNTHAGNQVIDGVGFSVGNRDSMLHTGRHFPLTIEYARSSGGLVLYLSSLDKNIEKFIYNRLFGVSLEVKIDGIGGQYGFEVHKCSLRLIIGKVKVFKYNIDMKDIDKFFSDADRLIARWRAEGTGNTTRLAASLKGHFDSYSRGAAVIAEPLSSYWKDTYTDSLSTAEGQKDAVSWLGSLNSLLAGEFDETMDFPERDWAEIRDTINAEAESMDMDLLSDIMMIIVDRGYS